MDKRRTCLAPVSVREMAGQVTKDDVALVGKGANWAADPNKIEVPPGFCLTADAYRYFLRAAGLEGK